MIVTEAYTRPSYPYLPNPTSYQKYAAGNAKRTRRMAEARPGYVREKQATKRERVARLVEGTADGGYLRLGMT
jgi:hypothetical protein